MTEQSTPTPTETLIEMIANKTIDKLLSRGWKPPAEVAELVRAERERCAAIAESKHRLTVGVDTLGKRWTQSTAQFPDDGRKIASAIRAPTPETVPSDV